LDILNRQNTASYLVLCENEAEGRE